MACPVLENEMVRDYTSMACRHGGRIVIDDRSRLPSRFFGRLTTAALAA
jgi:hypothetical protein